MSHLYSNEAYKKNRLHNVLEDESYMEKRREKVEQSKLCQEGWGRGQVR